VRGESSHKGNTVLGIPKVRGATWLLKRVIRLRNHEKKKKGIETAFVSSTKRVTEWREEFINYEQTTNARRRMSAGSIGSREKNWVCNGSY